MVASWYPGIIISRLLLYILQMQILMLSLLPMKSFELETPLHKTRAGLQSTTGNFMTIGRHLPWFATQGLVV